MTPYELTPNELDLIRNGESEEHNSNTCGECGEQVESIIGCPDGAEVCQQCFDAGRH